MTTGPRKTHDFCWINLMTHRAEQAQEFYKKLLGWTYGEMPGVPGGRLILVGGQAAGAFMDLDVVKMPPGTPPVIGAMVRADDADAIVAKVNSLGGRAEGAFDVLENGRMAMFADPTGAHLNVWQPKKVGAAEHDSRAHGGPTWFELLTTDADRAAKFYCALFGWKADRRTMPGTEHPYTVFSLDDVPIGGAMQIQPHMGNVPSHWGTYFAVDHADDSVKLATKLGAEICIPPTDIPEVGRFAMLKSPQGVSFYVLQYVMPSVQR
jgi:predicted enzyme related to lactoylglutathione lyase